MSPDLPDAPRFDPESDAWVLSRYADVWAALQEPKLRSMGPPEARDESGRLRIRPDVQDAFSAAKLIRWQAPLEEMAQRAVSQLTTGRPVELVRELALPWCLEVAMLVTEADAACRPRLADLSEIAFAGTGAPDGSPQQLQAADATRELQRILQSAPLPMAEPTFVGASQTLARLLAGAWLALVEHPAEWRKVREQPEMIPRAVDELLRFGGIVRSIVRRATAEIELGGVRIAEGARVLLMLGAANRDPAQFPEPDRLDVSRRPVGQVALGAGRNSCVGAPLIRMAAGVITAALVARFEKTELATPVEWTSGARFRWPVAICATLALPHSL